jgi:hypothetical protein
VRAVVCFDSGDERHPIAGSCLTPAKRDQGAVRGEWPGAAGTVHGAKPGLVELRCGKRPRQHDPANGRGKAP